mmetsp:Transcript_3426/g.10402  ORF Transcript_3426/g.10402 Transcript_3426/m.10402 type:complete len:716 (+) Transcript_3426:123-2270(+)|eukprot:CAMPEP_0198732746 /NCGR_PEP_ID=MMETSP1475-20131203/38920_1 /TAXON_ID= ORGANISM="Unidentified sp., Strain CCMP1999" /NCGR_SAMPLE_ID=MMETSP1475 /ASSEMBLY_ACC=CAM_ASM_001111 /LENGTH=715 /DNA_ID=CAMNT_0044495909 /DNA_START=120 /DNA_END=2267 /DNA_ORIENTATION=-
MDLGSIFNKAGETWKHLEKDFSKELGLSSGRDEKDEVSGWNEWQDDEWEDIENDKFTNSNTEQNVKSDEPASKQPPTVSQEPPYPQVANKHPESQDKSETETTDTQKHISSSDQPEDKSEPDVTTESAVEPTTSASVAIDEVEKLRSKVKALELQNSQLGQEAKSNAEKLRTNDRKVRALTKECEALRRSRDSKNADTQLLKEKQKQVEAVLEEGKQLSIKISEREQSIKQLKNTVEELREEREEALEQLKGSQSKVESLSAKLRQQEVNEKDLVERCDAAEKRLRELEDTNRSRVGTAAALDATRAELDGLKKNQSRVLEELELRLNAEAQTALETLKKQSTEREAKLNKKITELNAHLTSINNDAGQREDSLRWELQEARKRCQVVEAQNEDLSAAIPDATRPLLRQIEALQGMLAERTSAIEVVERSQLEQLREAQYAASSYRKKLDEAEKTVTSFESKLQDREERLRKLETERSALSGELADVRATLSEAEEKYRLLEDEIRSADTKLRRQAEKHEVALAEERKAHVEVINMYDEREESVRQKVGNQEQQIREMESSLRQAQRRIATLQVETTSNPNSARSVDSNNDIQSLPLNAMYGQERIQATLRQRTEEVKSLQEKLSEKDKFMKKIADEVVRLTGEMDEMRKDLGDSPQAKQELADIHRRHDTLMVLYGERVERIQELEQDLKDVNNMYKEQINDLLLQIEQLERQK